MIYLFINLKPYSSHLPSISQIVSPKFGSFTLQLTRHQSGSSSQKSRSTFSGWKRDPVHPHISSCLSHKIVVDLAYVPKIAVVSEPVILLGSTPSICCCLLSPQNCLKMIIHCSVFFTSDCFSQLFHVSAQHYAFSVHTTALSHGWHFEFWTFH